MIEVKLTCAKCGTTAVRHLKELPLDNKDVLEDWSLAYWTCDHGGLIQGQYCSKCRPRY